MDVFEAEVLADELISAELAKQGQTFGPMAKRTDILNGEFQHAGMAQLDALFDRQNGEPGAFDSPPEIYPQDWSDFRDHGSDSPISLWQWRFSPRRSSASFSLVRTSPASLAPRSSPSLRMRPSWRHKS